MPNPESVQTVYVQAGGRLAIHSRTVDVEDYVIASDLNRQSVALLAVVALRLDSAVGRPRHHWSHRAPNSVCDVELPRLAHHEVGVRLIVTVQIRSAKHQTVSGRVG